MLGGVDGRLRPVVRIERPVGEDSFLAIIDTGFNGDVFMSAVDARLLGIKGTGVKTKARFADTTRVVEEVRAVINWLGRDRNIELLLSSADPNPSASDEPIALIGTRLMTPHLLLIDFQAATVEIEEQD